MDTQADSGQTDGHTVIQTCRQIDKKRDRQVERQIFASEKKIKRNEQSISNSNRENHMS